MLSFLRSSIKAAAALAAALAFLSSASALETVSVAGQYEKTGILSLGSWYWPGWSGESYVSTNVMTGVYFGLSDGGYYHYYNFKKTPFGYGDVSNGGTVWLNNSPNTETCPIDYYSAVSRPITSDVRFLEVAYKAYNCYYTMTNNHYKL